MPSVKMKSPASEPVGIGVKLRKAFPWFEALAQTAKDVAVSVRRKQERAKGAMLTPDKVVELADELEEIQLQLNPLETRRKEIVDALLAHWGHTGIEEVEGKLGQTLIATSFELAFDPDLVKKVVGEALWQKVTTRTLQAGTFLQEGSKTLYLRDAALGALKVKKLKVSVTPPSSRRAKSGETFRAEEDEAA